MKKQMSVLDDSSFKDYQPEHRNGLDARTGSYFQNRNQNLKSPATSPTSSEQAEFPPKSRFSADYKNQYGYLSQKTPEPVYENQDGPDQVKPSLRRSGHLEDLRDASFSLNNPNTSSSASSSGSASPLETSKSILPDQRPPQRYPIEPKSRNSINNHKLPLQKESSIDNDIPDRQAKNDYRKTPNTSIISPENPRTDLETKRFIPPMKSQSNFDYNTPKSRSYSDSNDFKSPTTPSGIKSILKNSIDRSDPSRYGPTSNDYHAEIPDRKSMVSKSPKRISKSEKNYSNQDESDSVARVRPHTLILNQPKDVGNGESDEDTSPETYSLSSAQIRPGALQMRRMESFNNAVMEKKDSTSG